VSQLRSQISLAAGVALAVGMVVGSGLFGLPGLALQLGSPQVTAIGWLVGIAASIPLICVFSVLGSRYPSSSGLANYAEQAFGPAAGQAVICVLCGTFPFGIPMLAIIGASYALPFLGLGQGALIPVAFAFVLLGVVFNLAGVRTSNVVNSISLMLMVAAVVALSLLNIDKLTAGADLWFHPDWTNVRITDVWRVSALLFWAFLGWESLSFGLEEFRDPQRTIPWVYMLSFLAVSLLYGLLAATTNGAALAGVPVNQAAGTAMLFPAQWRGVFVVVIVLIVLANTNAWVFGSSRLFFAGGRSGLLPAFMGNTDRRGLPRNSIIAAGICFTFILALQEIFRIELSVIVMIVSQNFLILYFVNLVCFWKITRGALRWAAILPASVSCAFLLSGFDYGIIYPVALLLTGAAIHLFRQRHGGRSVHSTQPAQTSDG